MTVTAADMAPYPTKAARRDLVELDLVIPIGATGAVGTLDKDDPAVGCTRTTTGVYALTFPKSPGGRIFIQLFSPLGTVVSAPLIAMDFAAGTASFNTETDAGTPADPANGDKIQVLFRLDSRGTG